VPEPVQYGLVQTPLDVVLVVLVVLLVGVVVVDDVVVLVFVGFPLIPPEATNSVFGDATVGAGEEPAEPNTPTRTSATAAKRANKYPLLSLIFLILTSLQENFTLLSG
jgi:hypothetical protein